MLSATEQRPQERFEYLELIDFLEDEAPRLIFVDEASINTDMTRRYGRAPKGERVTGKVPRNTPLARSIIGALAPEGLLAAMEIEGAIDGKAFAAFIKGFLVRELGPGDIVIFDNNATHRNEEALRAIEQTGACVIWLPAYSPDFNPIEQCWAKIKSILRGLAARTPTALSRAFATAVEQITPENAQAWITHLGYWAHPA